MVVTKHRCIKLADINAQPGEWVIERGYPLYHEDYLLGSQPECKVCGGYSAYYAEYHGNGKECPSCNGSGWANFVILTKQFEHLAT